MSRITIISSLPPLIALSPYTKGLVSELSKIVQIEFLGFHHIYPSFLYPGKMWDESAKPLAEHQNLVIRNVLDWFNPFGWIWEAFRINTPIIHAQWWSFPLAPIYFIILGINKLRGKKIILTVHNVKPHEQSFLKMFLNKSIFCLGDAFIVHTEKNKEELEKIVKNKKISVIPHGLIVNELKGINQQEARKYFNINPKDKILLCFGHIREYKGLDIALKALAQIKDDRVKLFIAGRCWENWQKYEGLIQSLGLQERIILKIDFIQNDELEYIFRASDLILLPYKHFDAQSGVGALGLPYGIPMVVSKTGGLPEYVEDEVCIAEPNNEKDLANKIEQILGDEKLYQKLVDTCLQKQKELSWEAIAEKTVVLYE